MSTTNRERQPGSTPMELAADRAGLEQALQGLLINRDLSWLQFNRRVLALAADQSVPLLERVKFLAIFTNNLDEFFMKRVGMVKRQILANLNVRSPEGLTPRQQLDAIRELVVELQAEQARILEGLLLPALGEAGIRLVRYGELTPDERGTVDDWYASNAFPVLTPLAVDPGHRFPFISNLSENLGLMLRHPGHHERLFARVKIPDILPRFIHVPGLTPETRGLTRLLSLEELIRGNLDSLFPGMQIDEVMGFRVTRNAAVEHPEDDIEDLLEHVEAELRQRRFAAPVRLEMLPGPPPAIRDFVVGEMGLGPEDVYERAGPLEYLDLFQVADLNRPELKFTPWVPAIPAALSEDGDIFTAVRQRDVLLHHPYESFNHSVLRFIDAAARDPDVLAIKQTIYRTSPDSPFVESLIRAAEDGKQVACLVEVRARFDEHRNLRFAKQLEKHGVHVAYGVVGYKTHCKCSLVVRRESDGLRCYAHLGTGNYHPKTAQLYTDLGLLTADPVVTKDVVSLFNYLTGRSQERDYDALLVAPYAMRDRFNQLIDREIQAARERPGSGRIVAKMNAFEDFQLAARLREASCAGVDVTLIVRGFCCLRPGVPGQTERVRIMSVVGRFLEHSRVYYFANGREDPGEGDWFFSSADWMYRNLNNRVEAACPVRSPEARARLGRLLRVLAEDHANAWDMQPDGTYAKRTAEAGADPASPHAMGTFATLMREARGASVRAGRGRDDAD